MDGLYSSIINIMVWLLALMALSLISAMCVIGIAAFLIMVFNMIYDRIK